MKPAAPSFKLIARLVLLSAFGPIVLLLAAGDPGWTMGWAFSIYMFAYTLVSRLTLFVKNPGLMTERANAMKKDNVEPWDRRLVPILGVLLPTLTIVLAGLDHRFSWPPEVPLWIQTAAYIPLFLGGVFAQWAALENAFFSAVVRIQEDRGHTVVSTGPYRFIRHPGYAGGLVFHLAAPFALGSLWALIPVFATVALTLVRISLEDKTLRLKLKGYPEYASRTRWRLIPGIW